MRFIDADKLTELCDIMADKCDGIGKSIWNQFRTVVEWSPRVDAVPVIRCKDCKHRYHSVECPCQSYDHFYSWMPTDDWFCKKGERKEDIIEAIRKEIEDASEREFKSIWDNFDGIVE